MAVRTLDFLPEIFRTPANQKFLNATLEQVTKDPDLVRINGYVGRKFTPTYQDGDNYITEPTTDRANYQLEPTAVVKSDGGIDFVSSYLDLINSLDYHGAKIDNHDRLFGSEFYNFDGHIDQDKFVNFSQYYWLPAGPDAVRLDTTTVSTEENFNVSKSLDGYYTVSGRGSTQNPVIYLARGGSYTFNVTQNSGFWIQTEPGVSGTRAAQPNISTRQVFGVTNNGAAQGTVSFNVPLNTAQDFFTTMPRAADVDLVTNLRFTEVNNQLLELFVARHGGIDGQQNLDGKLVIFTNLLGWDVGGLYDGIDKYDETPFDNGYTPTAAQRFGVWRITLVPTVSGQIMTLSPVTAIPVGQKVLVREGVVNSSREFYKTVGGFLEPVPVITAIQDTLYYQDGSDPDYVGEIRLVEPQVLFDIDVEKDILGAKQYLAPNGVIFTNGLKVRFDSNVIPVSYRNAEFYVEGVGKSITLTRVSDLVTPELYVKVLSNPFDTDLFDQGGFESSTDRPTVPDYLTIKRSSQDLNPWSRGNRWFHINVIKETSAYNNFDFDLDTVSRAQRPIIEFLPNLRLFNSGTTNKTAVDVIDTTTVDVFDDIESQPSYTVDGVALVKGMRLLVTAEAAGTINNRIYDVDFIDPDNNGSLQIHLTLAQDGDPLENDSVVVRYGTANQGRQYWFNGENWVLGQQKTQVNQAPKFDVFDLQGRSFSDPVAYPGTTFNGTEIFSYKQGPGRKDPVLGLPLSYRTISSVGDILFENDFSVDRFNTSTAQGSRVDSGFLHINTGRFDYTLDNGWKKVNYSSLQYQLLSYDYNGSQIYTFDAELSSNQFIRPLRVYIDGRLLDQEKYTLNTVDVRTYVQIDDGIDLRGKKITLQIYSLGPVSGAFYQIPTNLDNNALNQPFDTATLGQLRNHYTKIYDASQGTQGDFPGANNSRDLDLSAMHGNIVQHSSGLPYAMLFMTDELCNFMSSVDHARREYLTFKNKFLELCYRQPGMENKTPDAAVDHILSIINDVKTDRWPWYHSDMVPSGELYVQQTYTLAPGDSRTYVIRDDTVVSSPSSTAILLFLNGVQLIKDVDYSVDDTNATVRILDSRTLTVGDVLVIREYTTTNGSWIPETPTKLGLYPKYIPGEIADDTYINPVEFIRGHDGSLTPKFGDFRDAVLLELEKRIYNNIKVDYQHDRIGYHDVVPGQFRTTDYTRDDINEILGGQFSRWVGNNRIDYRKHDFFNSNDPYTWNYRKFRSAIDDEPLPGHWRAIFNYLYDTEHPDTRPWEMLGFAQEPDWWQSRYGPAPYTSGNLILWDDLAQGIIIQGHRAGVDARYARPGLQDWLPVDEFGQRRAPNQYLVKNFNGRFTSSEFSVGDQSPAETAWRNSSDYPYAVQVLLALTKPARYFGLGIDTARYKKNRELDQYLSTLTNRRPTNTDIAINGVVDDRGVVMQGSGYINWISDYVRSLNIDPATTLKSRLRALDIQLSYKMAGFSDKRYLKAFAEQNSPQSTTDSVLIPDDDYELVLKKSVPLQRLVYSAVIVQRTISGYRVEGYDYDDPFFSIVPSQITNAGTEVTILGASATIYPDAMPTTQTVPYGTEYATAQQVFDFLISYGRYLERQGFVFEARSSLLNDTKNWVMAGKEFLTWAQHRWSVGNIIMLSPVSNSIDIVLENSIVDRITRDYHGAKILDQNFNAIKERDVIVNRIDNSFNITTVDGSTVALAVFNTVQYEHVFVPNNTTVFNDIIYQPEIGSRQSRIRLVGFKTGGWTGNIAAPGFLLNQDNAAEWRPNVDYLKGSIVKFKDNYFTAVDKVAATTTFDFQNWTQIDYGKIKKGLLPNFTNRSANIETYYDTDNVNLETDADIFSKGVIGYRTRDYFGDLGLDDTSQVRFYQGYIKQKGTKNAVTALTRARLDNLNTDIEYYEEWAFRTGEYGGTDISQTIEIQLTDSKVSNDVSYFKLLSAAEPVPQDIASFAPSEIYRKPKNYNGRPFITRDTGPDLNREILRAGYARLDDVDVTIFDITDVTGVELDLDRVGVGKKIWAARDFNGSWNVYRVSETNVGVVSLTNLGQGSASVKTSDTVVIDPRDLVVIKGLGIYDGIFRVTGVISPNEFRVQSTPDRLETLIDAQTGAPGTVSGRGQLFRLVSVRYQTPAQAAATDPKNYWNAGERIWVDHSDSQGRWAVLEKSEPWGLGGKITAPNGVPGGDLGGALYITTDGSMVLVGAPGQGAAGQVEIYDRDAASWDTALSSATMGVSGFGTVITGAALDGAQGSDIVAIGAPLSNSAVGLVEIVRRTGSTWTTVQTLDPTGVDFGASLGMSRDARWLYVGSPGENTVYAYAWDVDDSEYVLHTTVTYPGSNPGDRFGHSVSASSDGSQIIIGAPYDDTGGTTDSGRVYVYDRSVEASISDGVSDVYTTSDTIVDIDGDTKVTIDRVILELGTDYSLTSADEITFDAAPAAGSVVRIDTNQFRLQQILSSSSPTVGSNFGHSLAICGNDCTIFVGDPGWDSAVVNSGSVAKITNQTRVYGTITGSTTNPTVTVGHGIRINDIVVEFTGIGLNDVIDDINDANVPGVRASSSLNRLIMTSDRQVSLDKLRISPHAGTALADLGLDVYVETQVLTSPMQRTDENFGQVLTLTDDAKTLFVGAPNASMRRPVSLDSETTTFDVGSTVFSELERGSGTVYVFEYLDDPRASVLTPGKYDFVQELVVGQSADGMEKSDRFGTSLAVRGTYLVTGAVGDDEEGTDSGAIYDFSSSGQSAWRLLRQQDPQIEANAINRVFVYSIKENQMLSHLDIFDPAKGKILGNVDRDLDYITDQDPASYNNAVFEPSYWAQSHVGQYWWDTSTVRYLDYEQGDYDYRINHWGSTFPGSVITIYEWVESRVLPSRFVDDGGRGEPRYPDDSRYVVTTRVDQENGLVSTLYYYWVGNRDTTENSQHSTTTQQLARVLRDPRAQGVEYAAIMAPDVVGLFNTSKYITGNDSVLVIDHDISINQQEIHAEYQLVQEDNPASPLPELIVTKMVDSLSGFDVRGNAVPQPNLPVSMRYGTLMRPRQTLFQNTTLALRTLVDYVNRVLAANKITDNSSLIRISEKSPIPTVGEAGYSETVDDRRQLDFIDVSTLPTGYRALVLSDDTNPLGGWAVYEKSSDAWALVLSQTYDTTRYWRFKDWYADDYDATSKLSYTVDNREQLASLPLMPGDTVKVRNRGNGNFEILRIESEATRTVVGVERGTIELLPNIYTGTGNANEIRSILLALRHDIFVGDLAIEFNRIFFLMVRYALIEQKNIDWVFKTSFIGVKHRLRSLETFPNYQIDNQDYLKSYLEEVKPYRTKIREYLLDYTKLDPYDGYLSDFDLPAYYDSVYRLYRSPSGEIATDIDLWQNDARYQSWYQNYEFFIDGITIVDGGSGYTSAPSVSITGGGGTGASAYARVSGGRVVALVVTNPGTGYTATPTVTLMGVGMGAKAHARLNNNKVRKVSTAIKLDRIRYDSAIMFWQPSTQLYTGDLVRQGEVVYRVLAPFITAQTFTTNNLEVFLESTLPAWEPNTSYVFGDIVVLGGEIYRAAASFASAQTFSTVEILTHVPTGVSTALWEPFTTYAAGSIISYGSQKYRAALSFTSGKSFALQGFEQILDDANDRAMRYYQTDSGLLGVELSQLVGTLNYEGTVVDDMEDAVLVDDSYLESLVESRINDTDLGLSPQDINASIGQFISTVTRKAPKELVPGKTLDSFDIKVYSIDSKDLAGGTAGIEIELKTYTGDGSTVEFSYSDNAYNDSLLVYSKEFGSLYEGVDYTQDYFRKTVTFNSAPIPLDDIYIYAYGASGDNEVARDTRLGDGITRDFDFSVSYSSITDSAVTVNSVAVDDYILVDNNGIVTVRFDTAPGTGDYIVVRLFNSPAGIQTYNRLRRQDITLSGTPADYTVNLDSPIRYAGPGSASIILEVDEVRLRPPNNAYYLGDGATTTFFLSDTIDIDAATVSDNDVLVFLNGQRLRQFIEYDINNDLTDIDIEFTVAPALGDEVVISCLTGAEFRLNTDSQILISPTVALRTNGIMRVYSFSNHDNIKMRTQVFIGSSEVTTFDYSGFDEIAFDLDGFDEVTSIDEILPRYTLSRPVVDTAYLWITLNGRRLYPGADFSMVNATDVQLDDRFIVSDTDIVAVTHFTDEVVSRAMGFRLRQNLRGEIEYLRISDDDSTLLVQGLELNDTEIFVKNASRLPVPDPVNSVPGAIMINKELITYETLDTVENKLGQIRRGTNGTGVLLTHPAGSKVVDVSQRQLIPSGHVMETFTDEQEGDKLRIEPGTDSVWYDVTTPAISLQESDTDQAVFLLQKHAYFAV
jgi:hypothetical protein